jgi:hypothetical protein
VTLSLFTEGTEVGGGSDIKKREKQRGKVSELTFSVPNKAYRETCWCRRGKTKIILTLMYCTVLGYSCIGLPGTLNKINNKRNSTVFRFFLLFS